MNVEQALTSASDSPSDGVVRLLSSAAMLQQTFYDSTSFVTKSALCENCSELYLKSWPSYESKEPAYLSILHSVFLAVLILASTIGNGLVSLVLIRKRHLSPSSRLVLSLCSSNLLLSFGVLPFTFIASVLGRWTFGLFWCWTSAFLVQFVIGASNMTLAAIAVDRYFAIVRPMSYSMTITSAKSLVILLVVWFMALTSSLPPFFGWLRFSYQPMYSMCLVVWEDSSVYTSTLFLLNILLPLLVMAISYGRIFQIARSKYKKVNIGTISAVIRIDAQKPLSPTQQDPVPRPLPRRYVRKPSWLSIVLQSPVKGFAVICCILGVFCLCWTPFVISVILSFCRISHLTVWQQRIAFEIALLSIPSYPVIYGLLNRSIRKDLFTWVRAKNQRKAYQQRNSATVGLLDYTPPFSQWQFNCQAVSTPLQKAKSLVEQQDKCYRKTSDDSGHYSLPTEDADTISNGSQLSGGVESTISQSREAVDSTNDISNYGQSEQVPSQDQPPILEITSIAKSNVP